MKLIKAARWVKYSVTFFLFISISGFILFLYYLPEEKMMRLFISQSELFLDRKVQIEDFRYTINGFRLNGVRIMEKDGKSSYLQARAIEIKFRRRLLLESKIEIASFVIHNPQITVDYNGQYSLQPLLKTVLENLKKISPAPAETKTPDIHIRGLSLEIKNTQEGLEPLLGSYLINAKIVTEKDAIRFKNLKMILPDNRGTIRSELLTLLTANGSFDIRGDADLHECSLVWVYGFGKDINFPYRIVSSRVKDLHITKDFTEAFVEDASCSLSNGNNVRVSRGYTRVSYSPRTLLLKEISAEALGKGNSKSSINIGFIEVVLASHAFTFDVGPVEGQIDDFLIMIPVVNKLPLSGMLKGSLRANGSSFSGDFDLQNFAFASALTGVNTQFSIRENNFHINGLRAILFGSPALIDAKTLNNKLSSFALNLSYDEYTISKDIPARINLPAGMSIQGNIKANKVHYEDKIISDAALSYEIRNMSVSIPRARCRFLGADIDGEANINTGESSTKASVFVRFFNLPAQNIGSYVKAVKNRLYGNASGQLSAEFYPRSDIPPAGTLTFMITNGKVVNTGFQNQLGFLLRPLRFKLEDLEFTNISGNVLFDKGGYHFSAFDFSAPEITLKVKGSISKKMVGNLDMTLQFTETFIRDIPNILYVAPQFAAHRKGGIYTYNLAVENKDILGKDSIKMLP